MTSKLLRCVFLAALATAVSIPAFAGELRLTMQDGRVTLIADNVPVRQILQEWARVGQTKIVNAERVSGPNLTLQLINTPEREALDIILRTASGYIAAPRMTPVANAAVYDRITIFMSTTRPPAQVASVAPPPTFQRPPQPDDSDEPINVQLPQAVNPGMYPAGAQQMQAMPGMQPQPSPAGPPQALPPGMSAVPGQIMSPKPGVLPQPQPQPGMLPNPYQPVQRPGGPGGPGGPGL